MLEASKSFKVGLEHLTCDLCSTNSADILVLIPTVVLAMYFWSPEPIPGRLNRVSYFLLHAELISESMSRSSLRPVALELWRCSLVNFVGWKSCHVCIECKTDGLKTFGTCLFWFWFRNSFTFLFKGFRGGVIRISPYSSYPYIVYITLPCIVRPSLVFVVFKQLLKHLWLFLAVVQLQSCIGIYIQRDVHA